MKFINFAVAVALGLAAVMTQAEAETPAINPGFSCPVGQQWSVNTPIPSCVPIGGGTDSPIPCNGGTVSWSSAPGVICEGSVGAAINGVTLAVTANNGRTGNASFTCTNGSWIKGASSTCVSGPCAAGSLSWTASGLTCQGSAVSTAPGSSIAVTSTNGNSGSATFACDATGAWGPANAGATCNQNCAAKAVSWTVGGVTCSGNLNAATAGATSTVVDSTAPTTGSSGWTCTGGAWSGPNAGASCVQQPLKCYSTAVYWTLNGNVCDSTIGDLNDGQTVAVQDTSGTTTGSASFTCTAGNVSAAFNKVCNAGPAPGCPSQQLYWSSGWNTCDATAPATPSGQTASLYDGSGTTTGTANATCTNGSWGVPYNSVCNAAAPTNCPGANLTWYQGSNACTAYAPNTASGGSVYLADTTAPMTGTANATCSNGSWGAPSGACQAAYVDPPPPAGCPEKMFYISPGSMTLGDSNSWYSPVPLKAPVVTGPVRALLVYPPDRGLQVSIPPYVLNSYGGSVFTTYQVFPSHRWGEQGILPLGATVVPRPYAGLNCQNGSWVMEQSGGAIFDATGG